MKRFFSLVLVGLCVPAVEPVSGNPATVPIVVARCAADPACRLAVVTIGGALYWQVRQSLRSDPLLVPVPRGIDAYSPLRQPRRLPRQRRSNERVPGESRRYNQPIIDNPDEASEEWSDYVWANDDDQARRKCEALAERHRVQLVGVKKVGRRSRYECVFRG